MTLLLVALTIHVAQRAAGASLVVPSIWAPVRRRPEGRFGEERGGPATSWVGFHIREEGRLRPCRCANALRWRPGPAAVAAHRATAGLEGTSLVFRNINDVTIRHGILSGPWRVLRVTLSCQPKTGRKLEKSVRHLRRRDWPVGLVRCSWWQMACLLRQSPRGPATPSFRSVGYDDVFGGRVQLPPL